MLVLIFIIVYFVCRAVFLSYAVSSPLEKVLGLLFFAAEAYVMFHAFGYFLGIYKLTKSKKSEPKITELTSFPPVAILIPARHEPKEILENTIASCYNLSYPSKTIYILDDSSKQEYMAEAKEIAQKYDCQLFRREVWHGAKAGILNDCIKNLTDKYIVIFDADQNPISSFLTKTISILENDSELALIQTPQYYSNLQSSNVAFAANMQQACFYEYICEAKSIDGAMMCCGTNFVVRRETLADVGGFDESTVTEDFATSFKLHLRGWKTLYYNHVSVFGQGPENLSAYFSQQNRWAMGNIAVLKKVLAKLWKSPSALRPLQWWEYLVTSSYYSVSWAYLFLIFCPIAYIIFDIPSFFMKPTVYMFSFLPYLILSQLIFYAGMKNRNYAPSKILRGQLLFFLSLPTYCKGTLLGLFGVSRKFIVTKKSDIGRVSYKQLWPQISLWAINLSAITWGINRFAYDRSPAVAVNLVWITYHFLLCSSIFYFNDKLEGSDKMALFDSA